MDRVGFEFAYPRGNVQIDLTSAHALRFDGDWVIPSSAPLVVASDYIRRGIRSGRLASPEWYLDGGLSWATRTTAAADFGILQDNQHYMLVHSFVDPWQRTRRGYAELVASNSKHAAVVMAVLN